MLAAIDVGTNTARLLLGRVPGERVEPEKYFRTITRLGGGFSTEGGLAPAAMERTLFALRDFSSHLAEAGVQKVRAVGTEALRNAPNGADFCRRVRLETALHLEIISGEEEARLCALGVMAALRPRPERCVIFDIGGGSTEVMVWGEGSVRFRRSYPLGAVVLCEQYPTTAEQEALIGRTLVRLEEDLNRAGLGSPGTLAELPLIGTAGTVTTLAAIDLEMERYDWRRVNNHRLFRSGISTTLELLESLPVDRREALAGMEKGRGDLIVPGTRIALAVMALFAREDLVVSDFGLLEGVLLSLAGASDELT